MAKNPFILYGGKGSVGNVVTYKREGEQVIREKVTEVKNPRTYTQSQQRNFFAPVSKFYAPLAIPLEQSFEGLTKSKSYTKFLKTNIELARREGYYLQKGMDFFPLPYKVSQGTLTPINQSWDDEQSGLLITPYAGSDSAATLGGFSQDLIDNFGALDGDQVTIIAVRNVTTSDRDSMTLTDDYMPTYVRFFLNSESTDAMEGGTYAPFSIRKDGSDWLVEFANEPSSMVACVVILSRWENNKWRRSTNYLQVIPEVMALVQGNAAAQAAIESYMDNAYTKQSSVYLNGSTASNSGTDDSSVPARLRSGGAVNVVDLRQGITQVVEYGDDEQPIYREVSALLAVTDDGNTYPIFNVNSRSVGFKHFIQTKNSYGDGNLADEQNVVAFSTYYDPEDAGSVMDYEFSQALIFKWGVSTQVVYVQ